MTHATAEQIHDHACGFRRSDHVESCPDCRRAADVVGEELDALRDVLRVPIPEAPKARRRFGPVAVAAAALLLGALSWVLFQPHSIDRAPAAAPQPEDEIQRLIGELKGPSPERREIARLALKRYGGTAVEALARAQVDPAFQDELRGITPADRALLDKMKSTRITLNLEKVTYTEVIYHLAEAVGIQQTDYPALDLETAFVSFKVDNATVHEALEKYCAQLKQPFSVQYGRILIGRPPAVPSSAPIRLPVRTEDAARRVEELSNDVPARRDQASAALRRMGFAAEKVLWDALGSSSVETRTRAAQLLRLLYTSEDPASQIPSGWRTKPRVSGGYDNMSMDAVIAALLDQSGMSLIRDSSIDTSNDRASFMVQDIQVDMALKLLLSPRGIPCLTSHDCALIAPTGGAIAWTARPHVRWAETAEARVLEALIADLASADPARHQKAERGFKSQEAQTALDVLAYAVGGLEGEALVRAQRLRRTIAEYQGVWLEDLPSGADLQKLTPAQAALLDARVTRPDRALTLAEILKADGVRFTLKAERAGSYRLEGTLPKRSSLLKILLRPRGLDYYFDGETLVVDTTANVRAAVEK